MFFVNKVGRAWQISHRLINKSSALQNLRCASSVVKVEKLDGPNLKNEPLLSYLANSPERTKLEAELKKMSSEVTDIPIVIGGEEIRSGEERYQVMPHKHSHKIAKFYYADAGKIHKAITTAVKAQESWDRTSLSERVKIWEKAADLMATKYRAELLSATMLGQAKTIVQAEIDAAAELIDFMRMNVEFLKQATHYQPLSPIPNTTRNHLRFRGIDGFIAAIAPFNFTAIGGNIAYTPALMGNAVLWKPSDTAVLSNWIVFKIMREAGVPEGVVNFIPTDGPVFGDAITSSPHLAGINFTGSLATFRTLWSMVGKNINHYNNFPRMIGECGGKNYHFVHESADAATVVPCTIRSAFEYSGQKCSACSRIYVPRKLWETNIRDELVAKTKELKIGDVMDVSTFTSAVIDDKAFTRITGHVNNAIKDEKCEIIAGGQACNSTGYFVDPTIIVVNDPNHQLLTEEIFGPVLAVYVYDEKDVENAMEHVTKSTKYALTGAVFAQDEQFLIKALEKFKMSAGNFYINDKSTGSVVGQQPFGGGRLSGTNDKAGGPHYILRWTSPQSIKETYQSQTDIYYPYMSSC